MNALNTDLLDTLSVSGSVAHALISYCLSISNTILALDSAILFSLHLWNSMFCLSVCLLVCFTSTSIPSAFWGTSFLSLKKYAHPPDCFTILLSQPSLVIGQQYCRKLEVLSWMVSISKRQWIEDRLMSRWTLWKTPGQHCIFLIVTTPLRVGQVLFVFYFVFGSYISLLEKP